MIGVKDDHYLEAYFFYSGIYSFLRSQFWTMYKVASPSTINTVDTEGLDYDDLFLLCRSDPYLLNNVLE
jgi:hypothetical protein